MNIIHVEGEKEGGSVYGTLDTALRAPLVESNIGRGQEVFAPELTGAWKALARFNISPSHGGEWPRNIDSKLQSSMLRRPL